MVGSSSTWGPRVRSDQGKSWELAHCCTIACDCLHLMIFNYLLVLRSTPIFLFPLDCHLHANSTSTSTIGSTNGTSTISTSPTCPPSSSISSQSPHHCSLQTPFTTTHGGSTSRAAAHRDGTRPSACSSTAGHRDPAATPYVAHPISSPTLFRPPPLPYAHRQHRAYPVRPRVARWASRSPYARRRTRDRSSPQCLPTFPGQSS